MKKNQLGFTLIELVVVIAIIGILSSIILVSLSSARGRGANAAIKASMTNMRSQGIIYFDANQTYGSGTFALCTIGVFTDPVFQAAILAVNAAGGTVSCHHSSTAWMMITPLKIPEGNLVDWCVDDSGASKGLTASQVSTVVSTTVICP